MELKTFFIFNCAFAIADRPQNLPKKMKNTCLVFSLLIICLVGANAQKPDGYFFRMMETAIQHGIYPNIHSILISYKDSLIYEKYWAGNDRMGTGVHTIAHGVDSFHGLQSVSKSFTSACIGIALKQGKIKSIDQRIFNFFPEHAEQDTGLKSLITIKDLLTMTAGFAWNEEDYSQVGTLNT